jgi:DNA polymerase-2
MRPSLLAGVRRCCAPKKPRKTPVRDSAHVRGWAVDPAVRLHPPGCGSTGEITRRTGLPIALDGVYRWVAFLPSQPTIVSRWPPVFWRVPGWNHKVRGLEARRRDTPAWVSQTQMALIEHLAKAPNVDHLPAYLPGRRFAATGAAPLRDGQGAARNLLIAQRLTRCGWRSIPTPHRLPGRRCSYRQPGS